MHPICAHTHASAHTPRECRNGGESETERKNVKAKKNVRSGGGKRNPEEKYIQTKKSAQGAQYGIENYKTEDERERTYRPTKSDLDPEGIAVQEWPKTCEQLAGLIQARTVQKRLLQEPQCTKLETLWNLRSRKSTADHFPGQLKEEERKNGPKPRPGHKEYSIHIKTGAGLANEGAGLWCISLRA